MSRRVKPCHVVLATLAASACLAACRDAPQDAPASAAAHDPASSSTEASAPRSVAPSSSPSISPTEPASLARVEGPTPPPTVDEWKDARPLSLHRPHRWGCAAHKLHEWLKVHCVISPFSGNYSAMRISLLSGDAKDVFFWIAPRRSEEEAQIDVVLPLRRGERRLVHVLRTDNSGYDGLYPQTEAIVSTYWLAHEPEPVVTIH